MDLDTDLVMSSIKKKYLAYMASLEIPENTQKRLDWSTDNHITIFAIPVAKATNFRPEENRFLSIFFAKASKQDHFKILNLPKNTEIPYLQQKQVKDIYEYLSKHKLIDIEVDTDSDIFTISATEMSPDFNNQDRFIKSFEPWSYHFLDVQLSLIDFNDEYSYHDDTVTAVIDKVNDNIFSYQYEEASQLLSSEYYLGAACVFGVALERVCILIAQHNNLKIKEDKTELGFFAYKLFNAKIISDAFKKRLLGAAKFRNLSAHSNGQAVKSDALTLDAVINDLVDEYL